MATSQNGWTVIASGSSPLLVAIPKIVGRVRAGDVATVLAYLVARFDAEVEDVDAGRDDWGYAFRPIAGQASGYSNHASGTALDLNATRHVLGQRGTFTPAQVAALRRILAGLGGVVRWGGDYTGRADEMHFEIVGSAARVAAAAARIRGGQLVTNPGQGGGQIPTAPSLTAPIPIEEDVMNADQEAKLDKAVADAAEARRMLGVLLGWQPAQGPEGDAVGDLRLAPREARRMLGVLLGWQPPQGPEEAALQQLYGGQPPVVDFDEAELARQLAAAIPADLAGAVADELAKRLAD